LLPPRAGLSCYGRMPRFPCIVMLFMEESQG
jgi:hypothetical protein